MEIYKELFSKMLNKRLRELGRTQGWLVEELGLRQSNVSRWMTGQSFPKEDHFEALCKLLKVEKHYFTQTIRPKSVDDLLAVIQKNLSVIELLNSEKKALEARIKDLEEAIDPNIIKGLKGASEGQLAAVRKILSSTSKYKPKTKQAKKN